MQTGPQQRPALARYIARAEALQKQRGLTFSALAETMSAGWRRFDRNTVTAAVRGHQSGKKHLLPKKETVEALDRALGAGGELLALWRASSIEDHVIEIDSQSPVTSAPTAGREANPPGTVVSREEVSPTRRRDALRGGLVLGSAAAAAALSEHIATADPRSAVLDRYEAEMHQVARIYRVTPHAELAERLEPAWQRTESLLDTRVSASVRSRLTSIAGWGAFYLGMLGFDMGDDDAAREFLALASQHADATGDQLLSGSAAAMRSTVAYFNGAYSTAADIAHDARQKAHPFTRPVLAGCEARAAALAGRPEAAHAALADMQDHVWDGGIMPGPNPGDAAFAHAFTAVTLAHLGEGERAEQHARHGLEIELASGPDHFVQVSGKYSTLALTFLHRDQPEPEEAAASMQRALDVLDGNPTRGTIQRAGEMWREMTGRWPALPAVRDLGEVVSQSHSALPPASI